MKHNHMMILLVGVLLLAGCTQQTTSQQESKLTVAATFYPLEQATLMTVGNQVEVFSIVPAGVEPHGFEATAQDIVRLNNADAFVTLGIEFEAFEEELIDSAQGVPLIHAGKDINLLDYAAHEHDEHTKEDHDNSAQDDHARGIERYDFDVGAEDTDHDEESNEDHDEHDETGKDPHIWLSPINMKAMVINIRDGLIQIDPDNRLVYEQSAQESIDELSALHEEFISGLLSCQKDVVLINHNAFSYLGEAYGFGVVSVAGLSPESEPTPRQIAQMIDEAKAHDLQYIFYEELVDPRIAQTIATEVGAEVLELSPVGDEGEDYLSLMRSNLENLQIALECS